MPAKARPQRSNARAEAVALPERRMRPRGKAGTVLRRLAPSARSLAVGLGIIAFAAGAYAVARETSIFSVDRIDVRGGSPRVDAQVRSVLAPLLGRSLVGLDGAAALRQIEALPTVVSATYDRAFPHTLRIVVIPERPVAVLRSGPGGWLVSARGRVLNRVSATGDASLPRIWLTARKAIRVGEVLPAGEGGVQARGLAFAGAFGRRIATASFTAGTLVFHLRSGIELVVGAPTGVRLKLAVAARTLPALPAGSRFLDVSVPGRPVAGHWLSQIGTTQGSSRG